MLVEAVSVEGPRVLVGLQAFAFRQPNACITKTNKAYRWSLFWTFDADRSDGSRKSIVPLI
jgi:hypothetical protein